MSKIKYPAIFHKDENSYWVDFPDLNGCVSDGANIEEAYGNAQEALGLYLDKEGDIFERNINEPSEISTVIKENKNDVVMFVEYDSVEYAKKYKNKAIKKTLSIPEWLNDIAVKENINFSNVLQEALIKKLKL